MKILHIINSTRAGGGAQEMLRKLVTFPGRELDHRVVTLFTPTDTKLTVEPHACLGLSSRFQFPRALHRLRHTVRDEAPDVIVAWMYASCLISSLAAPSGSTLVWNIRHSLLDIQREKLSTRLAIQACAWLSRRADATIYCAQSAVPQHHTQGFRDRRVEIIGNGFDLAVFRPSDDSTRRAWRRRLDLPEEAILLGNAGRWHPMKNHKGLLEAFARLARMREDVHLVLAGRQIDARNTELAGLISSLGLQQRVTLTGLQSDMPGFLGMIDTYVQSSLWGEGFPNVLGEAMACATPVVTTDVGDSAHIVGEAGQIVTDHSAAGLAEGINALLDRLHAEGETLRIANRARIEAEFSLERIVSDYEALMRDLVHPSQSAQLAASER